MNQPNLSIHVMSEDHAIMKILRYLVLYDGWVVLMMQCNKTAPFKGGLLLIEPGDLLIKN